MEERETEEKRWQRLRERRRWNADDGRWAVEAWAASRETMAGFADRHGIHHERLRRWCRRLGGRRGARVPAPAQQRVAAREVTLLPVTVRTSAPVTVGDDGGVVVSAGGVRIAVRDLSATSPDWVARLVGRLAAEMTP